MKLPRLLAMAVIVLALVLLSLLIFRQLIFYILSNSSHEKAFKIPPSLLHPKIRTPEKFILHDEPARLTVKKLLVTTTKHPSEDAASFTRSAVQLVRSILANGKLDKILDLVVSYSVLELVESPLPEEQRKILAMAGWSTLEKSRISTHGAGEFSDEFTKLHYWSMVDYDRVIYLDSNCFVTGDLRALLAIDIAAAPLWATRDFHNGTWSDSFSTGVMMISPSHTEYERLMELSLDLSLHFQRTLAGDGFLNAVYTPGIWKDFGFGFSADLAVWKSDRGTWSDYTIRVIRFTVHKPWECSEDYTVQCRRWLEWEHEICPLTLVTAYFPVTSKHSQSEYDDWNRNMLSLDACMVIFVQPGYQLPERDSRLTVIHRVSLQEEHYRLNESDAFWWNQFDKDPEAHIHKSPELYWIWTLKSVFLRDAIAENPFSSTHFYWMDMGCLRNSKYKNRKIRTLAKGPAAAKTITFVAVNDFTSQDVQTLSSVEALERRFFDDRLSGASWGGPKSSVVRYIDAFFETYRLMIAHGGFVGKDQLVMTITCARNPGLCNLLTPDVKEDKEDSIFFRTVPWLIGTIDLEQKVLS